MYILYALFLKLTWKSKLRDRFKFLRRPPQLSSSADDVQGPVSKRPKLTKDVQEFSKREMEDYEDNVKSLKKEMEKKPRSSELCSLMEQTYQIRKKWIYEAQPPIADILTKFPAFRKPKVVSLFIVLPYSIQRMMNMHAMYVHTDMTELHVVMWSQLQSYLYMYV